MTPKKTPQKIILLSVSAGVLLFLFCYPGYLRAENRIENLVISESPSQNSVSVVIESKKPLHYSLKVIEKPYELEIQMEEEVLCEKEDFESFDKKLLVGIRYRCEETMEANPRKLLSSVSLLFSQKCVYTVSQKDWLLSFSFKSDSKIGGSSNSGVRPMFRSGQESSKPVQETTKPLPQRKSSQVSRPEVSPYDSLSDIESPRMSLSMNPSYDEIVQVGLLNHKPLDIAQKELKLAKRRLFEARRNFFPSVAGRAAQVEGKTQSDPQDPSTIADFRRKEVGVEIGQPLFQSGRLYYSKRRASAQKEAAEIQVQKLTQDVTFDIVRALFQFLTARESLKNRRDLQSQCDQIVETTKKKKEIGLASESEFLGVLSGANQIRYRTVSQEKDVDIAKTRFLFILNLNTIPEDFAVTLDDLSHRMPKMELNWDELTNKTLANRTELKIASLNKDVKEYERKIARAEYLFKIDASGFIGQSGAAFASEPLTMKDSYNVGVRGTLYFGGSSIAPLASKEKSAPDLGSSSRTETEAVSITAGVLDSLAAESSYLQSRIDEEKAKEDYKKIRKDILFELKESYFNYQKALLQIDTAKKELEYRKKEVGIAQAKDRVHQIEAREFLQSMASLTEAEVGYKEALSFYGVSLAALEKAMGIKLAQ